MRNEILEPNTTDLKQKDRELQQRQLQVRYKINRLLKGCYVLGNHFCFQDTSCKLSQNTHKVISEK